MISSLDELETALNAVIARLLALSDENARLRTALAEQTNRMRTAGHKLRVVAARLPQPVIEETTIATPEEKAA